MSPVIEVTQRRSHRDEAPEADGGAWERAVLASMREPIFVTGADGAILAFNAAAATLFGDPAHLSGRAIRDLLPFVDVRSAMNGESRSWAGRLDDVGGHTRDVEVTTASIAGGSSQVLYVIHDISPHVELNRLREQLLHSIAHELRTPMTVLENSLRLIAWQYESLTTQEFEQLIYAARRTTRRLRSLMDDLLSAGNIQSGRFVVNPMAQELAPIVESAIDAVTVLLDERHQHVEHEIPPVGEVVLADGRYIRQVLTNLLANASKYGPPDSVIRIATARAGRYLRVSVIDQGKGIPLEEQAGLFERFYRLRPGNEEPGVGLGLAIVKGIINAHGGTVGIESSEGNGASFWFMVRRVPTRQQRRSRRTLEEAQ